MKLKFKRQAYQANAVKAVVDCFAGQPKKQLSYHVDRGVTDQHYTNELEGFKNAQIHIPADKLLENIQNVQRTQNLPISEKLEESKAAKFNFDVEMETGTGKTYCYIKTIFELNLRYGWNKFVIVVPSIAIREGISKSFEITAEHFQETYHKKIKSFIYNSKQLDKIESFSSDAGINVMIINIQAFNAAGKDNRRIYEELDDFQSRRPIDVIQKNNPILILDEPQKMEGKKTIASLAKFNPLFILRYSATHKTQHNKIHRLDALDAYNQKLVKKISVRGISVKGLTGTDAYLYLEGIEISKQNPIARIDFELKQTTGTIVRKTRKFKKGDNLYALSNNLEEYRGFVIADIDARNDTVSFTNGEVIKAGDISQNVDDSILRRLQIREAINAHLKKEQELFQQGIKVLSLFFIDEVAKYRQYDENGILNGEYADIFEEEFQQAIRTTDLLDSKEYKEYLSQHTASQIHNGYFSIDKKGRIVNAVKTTKSELVESTDQSAYDLILKDKERLLSFEEPTRFIFSHSALREGWDNPNVFVICTLKHSENTISRRQEVGRGLRIAVNQQGERQDNAETVHQTNVLTIVANESYKDFVTGLQKDISLSLSERPKVANESFFCGKMLAMANGDVEVTPQMAKQIYCYLVKNNYTDDDDKITQLYHDSVKNEELAPLPETLIPYQSEVFKLIDKVYSDALLPEIADGRNDKPNRRNENFDKKEFQELWGRINKKAAYSVHFDSDELIKKSVSHLNANLAVTQLQFTVEAGMQRDVLDAESVKNSTSFKRTLAPTPRSANISAQSQVKYDLVGSIAAETNLTRKTTARILTTMSKGCFDQFKQNPEDFIAKASRLINEQKATTVIEHLTYDLTTEEYDQNIFTEVQSNQSFSKASEPLKRHIYDYLITDSKIEKKFAEHLEISNEVVVYAKLPRGFFIPTPVGNYNPDWAIAFEEGTVKHVYFVAETKGNMNSMELREIEATKIKCARKFFEEINANISPKRVTYDVVNSYEKLIEVVGVTATV